MVSVALIGADGAGKTTTGRRLEQTLPLPVKYIYMGVNADSSNLLLPTTRLIRALRRACGAPPDVAGPRDPDRVEVPPKGRVKRVLGSVRSCLSLINRVCEEWYRQAVAWYYQRQGKIVVFDRHFFSDYYAHDIAAKGHGLPLSRRIHGLLLRHAYPKPDLVIFLDAPGEVLYARKGEGTPKSLEHRRQEYLQLKHLVEHFVTVDACLPADAVARNVADYITGFQQARTSTASRVNGRRDRPRRDAPTILVTDAGRGSAISIIRSLGRRGWRVIAADSLPRNPGFRSRFAHQQLLYPMPQAGPRQMVETLHQAAREHSVDLIIPVTDQIILPLSEARGRFEGISKVALPSAAALQVVRDKQKTLELAERLGVPGPRTRIVYTAEEAVACGRDLGWPIVLKPQRSVLFREKTFEFFGVGYAGDPEALLKQMRRFEHRCPVLLQEYCSGTGVGVELLLHEGRPLAAFQHKRIREVPITGGVSALRESMALDPVLYRHAMRLLEALNWTGLAMVEFKVGAGGPKLMEINGRVWGSLPLAVLSGMDFPGRLADLYLHGPPRSQKQPDTSYRVGVRARNLELDLVWIARVLRGRRRYPFQAMPGRRQALAALCGLLNPTCKSDIFSLDDPAPGFAEMFRIGTKIAATAFAGRQRPHDE
jgi:predicted ATP-grasp superfamily ATP-dependent carboligase/thymidylate kinase